MPEYKVPLLMELVDNYHKMFKADISTEALRGSSNQLINRLEQAIKTGQRDLQLENVAPDVQVL